MIPALLCTMARMRFQRTEEQLFREFHLPLNANWVKGILYSHTCNNRPSSNDTRSLKKSIFYVMKKWV